MTDESTEQSTTRPYSAIFDVQHSNERENGDADEQHIQNYRSLEEELNSLDIENKSLRAKIEKLEEDNRLLSSTLAQTQRCEGENHQKLMRSQESYEEMSRNLESSRRKVGELLKLNESLKAKKKRMAEQHIQNCKSLKEKSNSLDIENKSLRAKIEKLEEDNRLLSSNLVQTQRYKEKFSKVNVFTRIIPVAI
jgi:chromosome segregation ATPase